MKTIGAHIKTDMEHCFTCTLLECDETAYKCGRRRMLEGNRNKAARIAKEKAKQKRVILNVLLQLNFDRGDG